MCNVLQYLSLGTVLCDSEPDVLGGALGGVAEEEEALVFVMVCDVVFLCIVASVPVVVFSHGGGGGSSGIVARRGTGGGIIGYWEFLLLLLPYMVAWLALNCSRTGTTLMKMTANPGCIVGWRPSVRVRSSVHICR